MQWGITLSSLLGKIEQVMAIGLSQHREQALDELALAGEDRACAGICVARIAIAIPGRAFPDVAGSDIENVSAGMSALPPFFEGERTMARIWVSRRWCSFQCPQCHAAIGHSEPKIAVVTPTHVYLLLSHADGPFVSRRPDCVAGVRPATLVKMYTTIQRVTTI